MVVRRQWILDHDAPAELVLAATQGARVTCVSASAFLGLWTPEGTSRIHLSIPAHSSSRHEAVRWHRSTTIVPSGRTLVEPVENVLDHVARCLPHEQARAVWESAIIAGHSTPARLRATRWRSRAAQRLSTTFSAASGSGIETLAVTRLARAGIHVQQQVWLLGHEVDGLIGDGLVVQFDGFAFHSSAADRSRDIAHDRALQLAGYTVLRFDYRDVTRRWSVVENAIRAAMAQGRHRRTP